MTDRRLVAVGVVLVAVAAVATGLVLGVFDGSPSDEASEGSGSNGSVTGDDPTVSFVTGDDDRLQVVGTTKQWLRGESDLPPGTEIEVRVTSTGPEPWTRTETVEVNESGRFAARRDLSPAASNETFQVAVVDADDGTQLANATGVAVADDYASKNPAVALWRSSGRVMHVAAAPNRTILGKTDLPPGTVLEVDLRSQGSDPFLKDFEAAVDAEGTFAGTADFSDVPANTSFNAIVSYAENGTEIVDSPGVVVRPES